MRMYLDVLGKYALDEGRASRQEWVMFLGANVIFLALIVAVAGQVAWIIVLGFLTIILLPTITLGIRRMHDRGKSGWWFGVPGFGLVLALGPGEISSNRFGPVPLTLSLSCSGKGRYARFGRFAKPAKGSTIVFLVRRKGGKVVQVLHAMKKRGFGMGWWNGPGGKLEPGETFRRAAIRETFEEIGVTAKRLEKVMEVSFLFPHKPALDQTTHVFLCDVWTGEPKESEEMKPAWFAPWDIPYQQMWPSDHVWIPRVLAGEIIESQIMFDEHNQAVKVDIRRADEN